MADDIERNLGMIVEVSDLISDEVRDIRRTLVKLAVDWTLAIRTVTGGQIDNMAVAMKSPPSGSVRLSTVKGILSAISKCEVLDVTLTSGDTMLVAFGDFIESKEQAGPVLVDPQGRPLPVAPGMMFYVPDFEVHEPIPAAHQQEVDGTHDSDMP